MLTRARGNHDRAVAETPIAVFDFETTGLNPGYDRVIEIWVIRIDPGRPPRSPSLSLHHSVTRTPFAGR